MLRFLVRAFAVVGFLVTLLIVLGALAVMHEQQRAPEEPENVILSLDFDQEIVERADESPLDLAMHDDTVPLLDILRAIDKAKEDPHVKGIVAHFGSDQPSLAQAQEIRSAIARFRTTDKFTYAFASSYGSFGLGNRAYYLASAFENIWLQPVGSVGLSGVEVQSPFAKTALDKIGVKADFMQREEYKSVMETVMRDDFSPPVKEMMQGMVNDLANQIAVGIADSRKWNPDRVKRLMDQGPFTEQEAVEAGLVTHVGYADDMNKEAEDKAGADAQLVDIEDYLSYSGGKSPTKHKAHKATLNKIALIYGTGLIVDKASGPADISGEKFMGANTLVQAFDDAADDKSVKAILFRIDSPGGSPDASETIRSALIHAQKMGKPVIVSMGDVAASGGYWIAMNADRIIADPGTLTGSIGVVSGKFVLSGLMQKLGITWGTLKTSDSAGMWSANDDFSPAQRARVNALLDQTYQAFVKNVSTARKIPIEKMPDIAKGRVWTGAQAVQIGLVDQLGGYDVAMGALRKKLGLGADDPVVLEPFPPPETPMEKVLKLLKGIGIENAMIRTAFGQWQGLTAALGPAFGDMASLKPVNARMPTALLNAVR